MPLKEYERLKQISLQATEDLKKAEMVVAVYDWGYGDYLYRIENPTEAVKILEKNLKSARQAMELLQAENKVLKAKKRKWFWQ